MRVYSTFRHIHMKQMCQFMTLLSVDMKPTYWRPKGHKCLTTSIIIEFWGKDDGGLSNHRSIKRLESKALFARDHSNPGKNNQLLFQVKLFSFCSKLIKQSSFSEMFVPLILVSLIVSWYTPETEGKLLFDNLHHCIKVNKKFVIVADINSLRLFCTFYWYIDIF